MYFHYQTTPKEKMSGFLDLLMTALMNSFQEDPVLSQQPVSSQNPSSNDDCWDPTNERRILKECFSLFDQFQKSNEKDELIKLSEEIYNKLIHRFEAAANVYKNRMANNEENSFIAKYSLLGIFSHHNFFHSLLANLKEKENQVTQNRRSP